MYNAICIDEHFMYYLRILCINYKNFLLTTRDVNAYKKFSVTFFAPLEHKNIARSKT